MPQVDRPLPFAPQAQAYANKRTHEHMYTHPQHALVASQKRSFCEMFVSDCFLVLSRYRDRMAKEEKAEIRQMNEEEGIKELDDDEKEKLIDLDQLTAMPNKDDVLHYCLPVCAPYFAMQSYKYKVKLTPGTGKKGKVGKQAKEIFGRMPEATQREKDLIKVLMDAEIVQQLMGNVRIAGGGSGGKGSGKGKK